MSKPSRAQRRQHSRGGSAPPPRRDPMAAIYIGVGVLVVAIIAAFGFMKWQAIREVQAAVATPSPGPNASSKPIQLADGGALGTAHFKQGDTPTGGHGQPVDGIGCGSMEYGVLHIHSHVSIFVNGKQYQIPRLVGGTPTASGGCLYWLHTHDEEGIIHVETPQIQAPGGGTYTLGMFFDIWGQPLARDNIAGFKGPVTAYVNGAPYDGDLHAIPLLAHQQIVLEVGKLVPPPNYAFPPND